MHLKTFQLSNLKYRKMDCCLIAIISDIIIDVLPCTSYYILIVLRKVHILDRPWSERKVIKDSSCSYLKIRWRIVGLPCSSSQLWSHTCMTPAPAVAAYLTLICVAYTQNDVSSSDQCFLTLPVQLWLSPQSCKTSLSSDKFSVKQWD